MKFLGEESILIIGMLILSFGTLAFILTLNFSESEMLKKQTYECISKGGTLIEGERMNFCIEKFIQLEQNEVVK